MQKSDSRYQSYIDILKSELVPAAGCTEPIAIAFAAARARRILGCLPERVDIVVSGNIIKNVKSVIVPNTGGMKGIAAATSVLEQGQIAQLETTGSLNLMVEGQSVTIESADVEIISEDIPGWLVSNEGNLTVALEVELTEELRNEGMARELINRIQNMRKDNGYEITDRISIVISNADAVEKAVEHFADYIKTQVLADSIAFADNDGTEVDLEETKVKISISKN